MGMNWFLILWETVRINQWSWASIPYAYCCSVAKLCLNLCDHMFCNMQVFTVLHYSPEFAQTHFHWVGDAIQQSHSLSSPSPPAFNLSQHQGFFPTSQLFPSGGQIIEVLASASVLPMNIQDWFPLGWTGWISLQAFLLADSQESSPTPQFKNINFSALSFLYSPTLTSIHDHWKKP